MEEAMTMLAASLKDLTGGAIDARMMEHLQQQALSLLFELGGVEFLIIHNKAVPHEITVYCVFGDIPPADETLVMRRMLEVNIALVSDSRAGFGIDAQTGEAAYAFTTALDVSSAAALVSTLRDVARNCLEWRETHFLEVGRTPRDLPSSVAADLI